MRPVLHSGMNEINHCQETGESWATGQAKGFLPPRFRAACQSCRPYWQPLLLSNTSSRESFLPNWALSQLSNLQSFWPWRELPRMNAWQAGLWPAWQAKASHCLHRTFRILSVRGNLGTWVTEPPAGTAAAEAAATATAPSSVASSPGILRSEGWKGGLRLPCPVLPSLAGLCLEEPESPTVKRRAPSAGTPVWEQKLCVQVKVCKQVD